MNFWKFLRTPFFIEHLRWVLLNYLNYFHTITPCSFYNFMIAEEIFVKKSVIKKTSCKYNVSNQLFCYPNLMFLLFLGAFHSTMVANIFTQPPTKKNFWRPFIFRFLCFTLIHNLQNLCRQERHYCILRITFVIISYESQRHPLGGIL